MHSPFYQPSGRIPVATGPVLLAAIACAGLAALPYAWMTLEWPWYVNVFATFGFAFGLAGVVHLACQVGRVRNPGLMRQFGLAVGLSGWALQWLFWIVFASYPSVDSMPGQSLRIPIADLFSDPGAFARGLGIALDATDWFEKDRHELLRYVSWFAEFLLLTSMPAAAGYGAAGKPFCEAAGQWATVTALPQQFVAGHLTGARSHFIAHPEQLLPALTVLTSPLPTHARVTLYRGKAETYISVDIVKGWTEDGGSARRSSVLEYLRVPGRAVDAFLERVNRAEKKAAPAARKKSRSAN